MAADITSSPTIIQKLSMMTYTIEWTGTSPVGVLAVQVSNNYSQDAQGQVANAGTWIPIWVQYQGIPVVSIPVTGNTGNGVIDVDEIGAYAIRLVYTRTSGVGTMNAMINAKVS